MTPERSSVLHSWCVQADWDAPTIAGGQGAWFWDEAGRRYLDMSSLSECMTLGHQHPALIRAIREQAEKLCYASAAWGAEPRARLAELLLEKSGFEGGRVYFTLGGADANEHAVKFARQAAGKPRGWIITRDRSYHGASYGAMALSGDTRTRSTIDPARSAGRPRSAAIRVSLPLRRRVRCGVRRAERPPGRTRHRRVRCGRGGRGAHGSQRRHQRHRCPRQLLAPPARGDAPPRSGPDCRRGHERVRALR